MPQVNPKVRARIAVINEQKAMLLANAFNLGAISKDDRDIVDKAGGLNPAHFGNLDSAVTASLDASDATLNSNFQTRLRTSGLVPAQQQLGPQGPGYQYLPAGSLQGLGGGANYGEGTVD